MSVERRTSCNTTSLHPRHRDSTGRRAGLPACRHHLCQRSEQDGKHVAGSPGRAARLLAARENEPDPNHPGASAFVGAALLRPVRWHRGAACRTTPAIWRKASRSSLHRQVSLAREGTAPAACRWNDFMVVGAAELFRRFATGTDMGFLATGAAYLPSSNPGADVAPIGRAARPGDLRTFGRREVGRG